MTSLRRRTPAGSVAEPALGPTSGTVSGWFGIVLALVVLVVAVTDPGFGDTPALVLAALLAISVVWTLLLRPRVVLGRETLVLRNGYVDIEVPWGLVDRVTVRSATHVFVGRRRYVGTAVGRSTVRMVRGERRGPDGGPVAVPPREMASGANLPDFLEARAAERLREATPGAGRVRRVVAWPEVALSTALLLALLVVLAV